MKKAYRSSILYFSSDPAEEGEKAHTYYQDGLLVTDNGQIASIGEAKTLLKTEEIDELIDHSGKLIMPGFIDTHIHYPQTEIIGSYGAKLLEWLNQYTFPAEDKFKDKVYASKMADFFLDELLRNGTTSAMVFGTVHSESVDAFFEHSHARNTRMICGKVMMDRNAPEALCEQPDLSYANSKTLIDRWHEQGRQLYAITPRFAITSTPDQLAITGKLYNEYPSTYLQTHLSENEQEIAEVATLFPQNRDYLDVYDQYGLLGEKSLFAHGIHLSERELRRLSETKSKVVFCPTSNLFLGSGLLNIETLEKEKIEYSLATDVGAGTSFSMIKTMLEAYKIGQLNNTSFCPLKSFYMATLGNAKALKLDDKIGTFKQGHEADFIVLDLNSTPLMALRQQRANSLAEKLFALIVLGDDRTIQSTYIAGEKATYAKI